MSKQEADLRKVQTILSKPIFAPRKLGLELVFAERLRKF